jgi:TetR/AcrR family transcriptional regulator, repressor for uid operon
MFVRMANERSLARPNEYSLARPQFLPKDGESLTEECWMTSVAEARQHQILQAAAICFGRRGFHQATMQDICSEVGLSPGSVYRYFRSKEELITALVEADRARHIARIEAVRDQLDVYAALKTLADQTLDSLNDPEMSLLHAEISAEIHRNPQVKELVRNTNAAILDSLAETLRLAQERGAIDPELDPRPTAELLVAVVDGLAMRKSLFPEGDAARHAALVHTMLSRFLRPGGLEPNASSIEDSPTGKE